MPLPLAYFLTWTCRGQRLHGDDRGSVDRFHNTPGTPCLPPDPALENLARQSMIGDPFLISSTMAPLVADAFSSLCEERRWRLLACNVRSTHVHIVVNCAGRSSPERAMSQLKARATLALRDASLVEPTDKLWTRHGSTRWINHAPGLAAAIAYVNDWQSGPNRELLEQHRQGIRERLGALRAWLFEQNLPAHQLTAAVAEPSPDGGQRPRPGIPGPELKPDAETLRS